MSAVAIAVAAAFNLLCTGDERTAEFQNGSIVTKSRTKYTSAYRIDLDKRRWCAGDCTQTAAIIEISDSSISLVNTKEPFETLLNLNRETGEMIYRLRIGDVVTLRMGQCERAPFSGFPTPKF